MSGSPVGSDDRPAGVVLAAGLGTRLRPLTLLRPKALCPVGGVPLLDRALAACAPVCGTGLDRLAVNAHHLAEQVVDHVGARATVRVEEPVALGTAGALGGLRPWLAGRATLVLNADTYLSGGLARLRVLTDGWDGERCRLLVVPAGPGVPGDFPPDAGPAGAAAASSASSASSAPAASGVATAATRDQGWRYVGACLLPWSAVRLLAAEPSGLYEVLWADELAAGRLDLVTADGTAIDCGTPADYLAANLHASGGRSVVGAGAVVAGRLTRSVVWDGAVVAAGEHLVEVIRAGDAARPVTVPAGPPH